MRKLNLIFIIPFLMNVVTINSGFSQSNPRHFANISVGETYNITTALQKDLSGNDFLGKDTRLNKFTGIFGLGYYYVRTNGLVIGGSSYVYQVNSKTVNGEVNLRTANVFYNMGYCLVNKDKWLAFPYAGIGLTGMNFSVSNISEHKDIIIYKDTISAGKKARYDAGGLTLDFGLSIKFNNAGLKKVSTKKIYPVIGIDIGSSLFPSFEYWLSHSGHDTMLSLSSPFFIAPYVRVTLGIGKMSKKADHRIW